METKQIGEIINQSVALQKTESTAPLTGEAKRFVAAINSRLISQSSVEEIKEALRLVMVKIGLRAQNWPNDVEKTVLLEHIVSNFGGNSIDEIRLAFEMAIDGKLDIEENQVNAYENFSCLYISRVMNSYRRWACQEYKQFEKTIAPAATRLLENKIETHWGSIIQSEYQHYLSFGEEKSKFWPPEFYDQLVKDGFIEREYFRSAMGFVRKKLISELHQEKTKITLGSVKGMDKKRAEFAESIRQTNLGKIDGQIEGLKSGAKDAELELLAKQYSVLQLFKTAKENFRENIYTQTPTP